MERRRRHLRSAGTAAAIALLIVFPSAPTIMAASRPPLRTASLERGRRDLPKVALTFDGGGDAGQSERILDVLEQRGATATFFLTGDYIRHNPELVRRIVAAGHEVGNHTWSHPHLTTWNQHASPRHPAGPRPDASSSRSWTGRPGPSRWRPAG